MRRVDLKTRKGFTMVELSLSIAFIAVLSIIVVVVIANAVSAYHKGLTLNQLNTAGMDVVEEMRTTVQSSPARSAARECAGVYSDSVTAKQNCEKDSGLSFIYRERYAKVQVGNSSPNVPVFGVFCTGAYSYLWNAGYYFSDDYKMDENVSGGIKLKFLKAGEDSVVTYENFKLLKVQDENRLACRIAAGVNLSSLSGGSYWYNSNHSSMPSNNMIDLSSQPADEEPMDLLEGDNNLAIYHLSTALPAEGEAGNMLYAASFVLGTVQGGVNVSGGGNYCATPEDYANASIENFDYCAINKFNFAAQATGG